MKILHIIPNLAKGGAERLVIDLIETLNKLENTVAKLIIFENVMDYDVANIQKHIQVIPVNISLSILKKNKVDVAKLQKAIEDFSPNIIHSHLFYAELASRSCYFPQAKWFSHCHDNMSQMKNFSLKTIFDKVMLTQYYEKKLLDSLYFKNGGNSFIAISNNTLQYFQNNYNKYPIHLIHNAIHFSKFYCNRDDTQVASPLKLINVGSFVDKKNQQFLVQVAKNLANHHLPFELHFLGDGPNLLKVKQQALDFGLEDKVFFHGNVERVQDYLRNAQLYVHSAYYEPLGLVLIEAMASGLPVICLDGKGNKDLMIQGSNGYLIEDQNLDIFAKTILQLWNNKEEYVRISKFAQNYAQNFDMQHYAQKLLNLYTNSLKR